MTTEIQIKSIRNKFFKTQNISETTGNQGVIDKDIFFESFFQAFSNAFTSVLAIFNNQRTKSHFPKIGGRDCAGFNFINKPEHLIASKFFEKADNTSLLRLNRNKIKYS